MVKPNEAGERLDDLIKSLQKVSSATPTTLSKSSSSSSSSAAVSSTSSSFKPQPLPSGGAAEASAHMQVINVLDLNFPLFSKHLCGRGFVEFYVMKVARKFSCSHINK